MVSISSRNPDLIIVTQPAGDRPCSSPPNLSPGSKSWEESLVQLAKGLQNICRSPDAIEKEINYPRVRSTPDSPNPSPSPTSPGSDFGGRLMPVRHLQSESKLAAKLSEICGSPRQRMVPPERGCGTAGGSPKTCQLRRPSLGKDELFQAEVEVGPRKAEDLQLVMEHGALTIMPNQEEDFLSVEQGAQLPAVIDIPPSVDPQQLMCVLRDGTLEVHETRRKRSAEDRRSDICLAHSDRFSDLSATWQCASHGYSPIIIQDDLETEVVRLVLRVPDGYSMEQIQIRTIDDHLIIKGHPKSGAGVYYRNMSSDDSDIESVRKRHGIGFTKIFELPNSLDPFSIVAQLTETNQLIIEAKLSAYRCKCNKF